MCVVPVRLLGALCRCICDPQLNAASQEIKPAESLGQLLLFHLNSKSALQRIAVALVLCEWAALQKVNTGRLRLEHIRSLRRAASTTKSLYISESFQDRQMVLSMVQPRLLAVLTEQLYYDEIAIPFTRMQTECKQLISLLTEVHVDLQDRLNCSVFTIDQANELVNLHLTFLLIQKPNPAQFLLRLTFNYYKIINNMSMYDISCTCFVLIFKSNLFWIWMEPIMISIFVVKFKVWPLVSGSFYLLCEVNQLDLVIKLVVLWMKPVSV